MNQHKLSRKALPLFFSGVVIATFVGGAVQAFFSSRQIEMWVAQTLEKEDPLIRVSFSSGELSLSKRALPRLGLVFHNVHVQPKNNCELNVDLFINQLYLPIQVFDFLKGQLRFRQIEVDVAELNLGTPGDCQDSPVAAPEGAAASTSVPANKMTTPTQETWAFETDKALHFFKERWPKEMRNTSSRTRGLLISELRIRSGDKPLAEVKKININTESAERFEARALLSTHRLHGMAESLPPTQIVLDADTKKMNLRLQQQIQEGRLMVLAGVSLESLDFEVETSLTNVPGRPLFDLAVKNAWAPNVLVWPRESWVNGKLGVSGNVKHREDILVALTEFKVGGDLGGIRADSHKIYPFKDQNIEQGLKLYLEAVRMDAVFEMLSLHKLKGLVQSFGVFSGEMVFKGREDLELVGDWEAVTLRFSRQGQRLVQKLSMTTEFRREQGRWSGRIPAMIISDGNFKGNLDFEFDERSWTGPFRVNISNLALSPDVQQLMWGGKASLSIDGHGKIEDGDLKLWKGSIYSAEVSGNHWRAFWVKAETTFVPPYLEAALRIGGVTLSPKHVLYPKLDALYLNKNLENKEVDIRVVRGQLSIGKDEISWKKWAGQDLRHQVNFSSEGSWKRGEEINGWISTNAQALKSMRWDMSGGWNQIDLSPGEKVLKEIEKNKSKD